MSVTIGKGGAIVLYSIVYDDISLLYQACIKEIAHLYGRCNHPIGVRYKSKHRYLYERVVKRKQCNIYYI